jgi:c-di-GMP-binding flagellar brake protein YcgR
MKEDRKSVRVDAQLFISYDILDEKGEVVTAGMALSKDLSKTGVQIRERTSFPVDSLVQINLAVGDEVVKVKGKVRHVEKVDESNYRIGIEFGTIEKATLKKLSEHYPEILKE